MADEQETETPKNTRAISIVATPLPGGGLAMLPKDFDQVWKLASLFASGGEMVPAQFRNNANATATAIMWGMEIGISPIQSLQGIAVINGRASLWGDTQLAVATSHPDFEELIEAELFDAAGKFMGWSVTCRRKGRAPVERRFTMADAAKAGLAGKAGPWQNYPSRMCFNRARSWALRDCMPDALRGMGSADEMQDVEQINIEQAAPRQQSSAWDPIHDADFLEPRELKPEAAAAIVDRIRAATPDHSTLAGDLKAMDDFDGPPSDTGKTAAGELFDKGTGEVIEAAHFAHPALTDGQRKMVDKFIAATAGNITEQDVIDELGDSIHAGNLQRALDWIMQHAPAKSK